MEILLFGSRPAFHGTEVSKEQVVNLAASKTTKIIPVMKGDGKTFSVDPSFSTRNRIMLEDLQMPRTLDFDCLVTVLGLGEVRPSTFKPFVQNIFVTDESGRIALVKLWGNSLKRMPNITVSNLH